MFKFIKFFIVTIILYHLLNTIIIYWFLWWSYQIIFSLIKELLWIWFIIFLIIKNIKQVKWFLMENIYYILIVFLYVIVWVAVSLINNKWIFDIIIWLKYNIYFFSIFITSSFIWYIAYKKNINKKIIEYSDFIYKSIIYILIFWIIWQIMKFQFWEIFIKYLWYWNVWDWKFWENPPLYYRTWPDWFPRLSWIFSWPNNYWFLLVAFFSFFIYKSLEKWLDIIYNSKKNFMLYYNKYILIWFYILSWLLTLSRWFIVWTIIQVLYFLPNKIKNNKKYIILIVLLASIPIFSLSLFKIDSTKEHITQTIQSIKFAIDNSKWLWLWSSWPAIHHWWTILPENIYLQIYIDTWSIWFIIWILFFLIIFIELWKMKISKDNKSENDERLLKYTILMWIWLYWLLIEWLFLHIFEDSMVNYIFFITFWILFWYCKWKFKYNKKVSNYSLKNS